MSKGFSKWLQMIEPNAKYFMWVFGMVLAIATVVNILDMLTPSSRLILVISLILFFFAGLIVFISDVRRRFTTRASNQQEYARMPTRTEQSGRNRWILIGLLVLAAVILVAIFVPRQLQLDPQGYQTFFIAFAGIGAWVTGIALAVFAYQQYKLRQTEHRLLFEPQLLLTSGNISITGLRTYPLLEKPEPFQIKWTVFIQNTSNIPILIEHMEVYVKLFGKDPGRLQPLERHCRVADPPDLTIPFEVTLAKPQYVTWIVEGSDSFGSAGDAFDIVSIDSDKRIFVLIARVSLRKPRDPKEPAFFKETVSRPIYIPKDANWVSKTPFLDTHEKQD